MKLPRSVHQTHPWLIGSLAPDFRLLDAWSLPVRGERDDFDALVELIASLDPVCAGSAASRALFTLRLRLGDCLGWDEADAARPIPGCTETTLVARLPEHLRDGASRSAIGRFGFLPLYRTDEEWAAELSNRTVHGVLQLAWVEQGDGRYRGRLGVYVKPRGALGVMYLMLIEPFRQHVVYPALMRQIERAWDARTRARRPSTSARRASR